MRCLVILALLLIAAPAYPASFKCEGRISADEKIVCAEPVISSLDTLLATVHAEVQKTDAEDARRDARDFLADRKACGSDRACILASYVRIIETLGGAGAVPAGITATTIAGGRAKATSTLPGKVGQCFETEVTEVHPRIGSEPPLPEDYDAGTGVEFANNGYQVSYAREDALIAYEPGDKVTMCLISIPHRCPPGDDRGRSYLTTNLRTGQSWAMGDSQHICGGM